MTPEIIENSAGEPYWFVAERGELRQAIADIPGKTLLRANRAVWTSRGLEPAKMTAADLRKRLLEKHERASPDESPERVLSVEEAARHLGLTGRVLGYRIQQGKFADRVRKLRNGRIGLAFKPPPQRWSLIVDRPDPRVLVNMVNAGARVLGCLRGEVDAARLIGARPRAEVAPGGLLHERT
jgi:hypothetical protein